ncbi:uncharacterized protein LOC132742001 isoform X4 [Ruditapes philippinarum]|uniref:uncharacterized protein LOC132742001 isoform X4 n=1 Tax=Ruditapes philippinarum TaxID=129788 RepID=UPI00295B242E|nr:uncharacterized protein LOC132742001 isoform X4 [Ruditapes philippinarum]
MSQWGGDTSSQPQASGQVQFFDPTKFQSGGDNFPHVPVSKQNDVKGQVQGHSGGHDNITSQDGEQNAWNSCGTWNTESNPYTGDFNADQQVNSEYNNYSGHPWHGQHQYNNVPLQNEHGAGQWDPSSQGTWDPHQQWNQHQQYNYQQGTDPNQTAGHNNYWAGQNGDYQSNVNYQSTDQSGQIVSSANYFAQEPNAHYAQSAGASYGQANTQSTEMTGSINSSGQTEQSIGDLNVSQSTEESESLNQSVANIEDGGTMGGFYNNDNYDEEEGESDDDDDDDEEDDDDSESGEGGNVSNGSNGNVGKSGSHIRHENEHHYEQSEHLQAQTVIPNSQTNQLQVIGQMQALNLQDNSVSQTSGNENINVSNVPLYSNQRNDGNNLNMDAASFVPQQQSIVPPQSVGICESNSESDTGVKQTTPTFSDWEMIPPAVEGTVSAHSRNASIDNNVHFFISSTNSSARVSPASSKAGEDKTGVNLVDKKEETVPNRQTDVQNARPNTQAETLNQQPSVGPPQSQPVGLPPPMLGGKKGGNPFRKSPNIEAAQAVSSNSDVSMLSSTRLDVTRPNFENSPVVLNQSISPITANVESTGQRDGESPELEMLKNSGSLPVTPVSSQPRKTAAVQQSPILPRKESPFQPPKQDTMSKITKSSQDIPEDPVRESVKPGISDKHGRRTPDRDRAYRSRTPDWDSGDRGNEVRRSERDSRRKTDRGYDDRERYNRDRDRYGADSDRVTTRPPPGSSTSDRVTRTRQSAFHHIQTNRSKNNVSPAASLIDVADNVPAMPNILLMPASSTAGTVAAPVGGAPSELNPVVSLISSLSEQITTDNNGDDSKHSRNDSKFSAKERESKDRYREKDRYRDRDDRGRYGKDRDRDRGSREDIRGNRSYDSLRDRGLKDSRNNSREKLSMYDSRDSLDRDDSRDRTRRGDSRERDRSYRDDYYDRSYRDRNRPPSRTSTIDTRRDYRDRDREYYRKTDRNDRDRPRSRQGEKERAGSRMGDVDRPRSRNDYDQDIERYRDKYRDRGYDYNDYYSRRQYYDRQYYDYYYGNYGQGYYDEHGYYHADPAAQRYQYEHYHRRSRTGTPGSLSDGGEEISSIAEKKKRSESDPDKKRFDYPPDLHDYSHRGYDEYYNYYGYEQNGHRWDPNISEWVATTTDVIPQRQTPEKFMIPHMRACFGPNGQLVKVIPNRPADGQPATVEIHDVQALLEDNEEAEVLSQFPGPLVRGDTHKNDVLLFCQNKAKLCTENMNLEDRDSAELIWRFLELLIKQNGTVVGTDIADLILQGHEPTTQEYRRSGMKIAASSDNLDVDEESEDSQSQKLSRGSTPIDRSLVVDRSIINKGRSVEEVTDRFRHLLMYGRKKDALDWAMKNNLWGHALFLASKMDSRAHANVMMRFANVAMRMNDPLQTLYQMMSGRQPAAVTCVAEERWGDWRPHLAMILSNHSQKPDLDRKSITTLGDTLASRGFLHASHFCYLMSQTSFGSYNKKSSKIVLVGSSHGLPLQYFATDEAIQCTEIYEYAISLGNMMTNLINFQTFKYLYATRLADYGFAQEALQYCEVISKYINVNPAFFPHILVKLVYDFSSQIKFSQPQNLEEDDVADPDWLRALHTTLVQFEEGAILPASGSATPAFYGGRTTASSDSGEVGMYMQGTDNGTMYAQEASYMTNNGQMSSIHENYQQQQHPGVDSQVQYQETQYGNGFENSQAQPYSTEHVTSGADNQYLQQQGQVPYQQQGQITDGQKGNLQWPEQSVESTNQNHPNIEPTNQNTDNNYQHQTAGSFTQYGNHWDQNAGQYQTSHGFPPDVNLGESQTSAVSSDSAKRGSLASTSSFPQDNGIEAEDHVDSAGLHEPAPSIFDLQPTQQKIIAPKLRKRTTSETSTGSGVGRDRNSSGNHNHQQKQKSDNNKDSLSQPKKAAAGGGFLSKIGGLFSRKNEMKLPDDKEPSIVWDDVKKRWVDKDGGEEEEKPAAPPPKDHELKGPGSTSQLSSLNAGPAPGAAPSRDTLPPGGNKFSMRRDSAGPKYVDVMNPKPATTSQVPSSLFHTLPSSRSAPAIFNPMGNAEGSATDLPSQVHDSIPEEKTSQQGADNSNVSNTPAGNLQLPPMTENTAPETAAAPEINNSMPAMFNPAQFQSGQTFKQPAPPGPGHRLSNRRVYPK